MGNEPRTKIVPLSRPLPQDVKGTFNDHKSLSDEHLARLLSYSVFYRQDDEKSEEIVESQELEDETKEPESKKDGEDK